MESIARWPNKAGNPVYERLAPVPLPGYNNSYIALMLGYVSNSGSTSSVDYKNDDRPTIRCCGYFAAPRQL